MGPSAEHASQGAPVRHHRVLAWGVAGVAAAGVALTTWLAWDRPAGGDMDAPWLIVGDLVAYLAFAVVGAIVASHHPRNPVGWLFLAGGSAMVVQLGLEEYAFSAVVGGSLPGMLVADWVAEWLWIIPLTMLQFAPLIFPTGTLPPGRGWRTYAWLVIAGDVALLVLTPLATWPLRGQLSTSDDALLGSPLWPVVGPLATVMVVPVVLSLGSLVLRYARSSGVERLQLRWLRAGAIVAILGIATSALAVGVGGFEHWLSAAPGVVGRAALPVAAGMAIRRRGLYEIDRIVSRTLSYAAVTAVLVGVYGAGVVGLGAVIPGERSDLLVAGTTLVTAALFRPVGRRIQSVVDRRFDRARYDAARTVERFAGEVRRQVALEDVTGGLCTVVTESMSPASVSVWLPAVSR